MTLCRIVEESTRLIHDEGDCASLQRTPGPPIQRGSTILLSTCAQVYDSSLVTYGRVGMATQRTLRDALMTLEHADEAFLYPSGLSAITGTLLALLSAGDEVLACDSVYNPTRRFLAGTLARFGVTARYFEPAATAETIGKMITPATRVIFLESPGSLTFEMQDIPAIARLARERGVLTVIDNTWSAGVLFKPLDHGVDVSIQSLTKYVCGHSDVFMGMAAAKGEAVGRLATSSHETGWAVSPDDAYMALRGLRTLHTRLAQHGAAGLRVAQWLSQQPEVQSVLCPALADDPGHAIWKRDFTGNCGLIGAVLKPVSDQDVARMVESLSLFGLGYSWGGFESLILPCDPQLSARTCSGAFPGPLLRLHIGLESVDDLIADLRHGLDQLPDATRAASRCRAIA
ncbi:MAG: cystathionine beta-lyase [Novosphingobium sp.]|jgi:cystathionine beta-lyase|nr:cystathionine beta-lyase [Novosphingobium sp.]